MNELNPDSPYGELGGVIPPPRRGQRWRPRPGPDGVVRGAGHVVTVAGVITDLSGYVSLVVYNDNGSYRVEDEHFFRSKYKVIHGDDRRD